MIKRRNLTLELVLRPLDLDLLVGGKDEGVLLVAAVTKQLRSCSSIV
jgi:hypothetical protein